MTGDAAATNARVEKDGKKIGDDLRHHRYEPARTALSSELLAHPEESSRLIKSINQDLKGHHAQPLAVEYDQNRQVSHLNFGGKDIYDATPQRALGTAAPRSVGFEESSAQQPHNAPDSLPGPQPNKGTEAPASQPPAPGDTHYLEAVGQIAKGALNEVENHPLKVVGELAAGAAITLGLAGLAVVSAPAAVVVGAAAAAIGGAAAVYKVASEIGGDVSAFENVAHHTGNLDEARAKLQGIGSDAADLGAGVLGGGLAGALREPALALGSDIADGIASFADRFVEKPQYGLPDSTLPPPVPDGHTRLYRGVSNEKLAGEFPRPLTPREERRFLAINDKMYGDLSKVTNSDRRVYEGLKQRYFGGRFFTDVKADAQYYAGKNGKLFYTDVPFREAFGPRREPGYLPGGNGGSAVPLGPPYTLAAREHIDSPTNPFRVPN